MKKELFNALADNKDKLTSIGQSIDEILDDIANKLPDGQIDLFKDEKFPFGTYSDTLISIKKEDDNFGLAFQYSQDSEVEDVVSIKNYYDAWVKLEFLCQLSEHLQDTTLDKKELIDKFIDIAEEEDWSVYDEEDGNYELRWYTPAEGEVNFTISLEDCKNLIDISDVIKEYWDGYDPDYEASLWIGDDGHGHNGAPHRISEIVADKEAVKEHLEQLWRKVLEESKKYK